MLKYKMKKKTNYSLIRSGIMRILVTGGGTGGHIYPALAMVRALQQLDNQVEVLYIGTENGLEKEIVTHEGI